MQINTSDELFDALYALNETGARPERAVLDRGGVTLLTWLHCPDGDDLVLCAAEAGGGEHGVDGDDTRLWRREPESLRYPLTVLSADNDARGSRTRHGVQYADGTVTWTGSEEEAQSLLLNGVDQTPAPVSLIYLTITDEAGAR